MSLKAGWYTPMLHVNSVEESIRFYSLLGFEIVDKMGQAGSHDWARMHCEGGAVMFLLAEEPVQGRNAHVLFAMYTPDLPAFRDQLVSQGVQAPPIQYPPYMPSGTLSLRDPDGYLVEIHHWSDKEHETWDKERNDRIRA